MNGINELQNAEAAKVHPKNTASTHSTSQEYIIDTFFLLFEKINNFILALINLLPHKLRKKANAF